MKKYSNKVTEEGIKSGFDWESYEDTGIKSLKQLRKKRISRGTYLYHIDKESMERLEMYSGHKSMINPISKDTITHPTITGFRKGLAGTNEVVIDTNAFSSYVVDLDKETDFLKLMGTEKPELFLEAIKSEQFVEELVANDLILGFAGKRPSLVEGYQEGVKRHMFNSITDNSSAYAAEVISSNRGGFRVLINGVEAFLPGSLATTNKVRDYQALIGTEIPVMIEKYDPKQGFIVSFKKYLKHIMPTQIEKLEVGQVYEGTVTGTKKFGIFVEFDKIFTGMIHNTKIGINKELSNKFNQGLIKEGDKIMVEIDSIKGNKIVLVPLTEKVSEKDAKKEALK